jgi:3-deoxy-D-manno-octulosonic-acid transferase
LSWLVDAAYLLAALVYVPVALFQRVVHGKRRTGWRERFGGGRTLPPHARRIWVHGVSLGEINAAAGLVRELGRRLPDADIVISATTDTGYARAIQLYGAERVVRYPWDFHWAVKQALRRIGPRLIVLMELEVWYNFVRHATRRGATVVVANGRITERSARRLCRLASLIRPMFADLAWVGAQDETIAERFARLGTPPSRITVTSSMKWDSALVADTVPGAEALAAAVGLPVAGPTWVCGSTGPGEDEVILEAQRMLLDTFERMERDVQGVPSAPRAGVDSLSARPRLVIVPRKPERFDAVAERIERRGFRCVRRSAHPDGAVPDASAGDDVVVLGDTIGELRKFYALGRVAFVGRSLVPMGGSDPMEIAALGKPIVAGSHMENFAAPTAALARAGALRTVEDARSLARVIGELLDDPECAARIGSAARQVVLREQGATTKTVDRIVELLDNADR